MSAPWILLRGWTREAAHWGAFPARLGDAFPDAPVVALDLPGCGRRHHAASPASVAGIAAQARAALGADGIAPPWRLFGLSLGGMVAAHWATAFPADVAGCVLVNTSMRGAPLQRLRPSAWPALGRIAFSADAAAAETGILALTSANGPQPALVAAWAQIRAARPVSRTTALRQLLAAARFVLPPRPACPALVLCSAADRLVDPRCSHALAARWQVPLAEHPHAGHDLPLDDPDWVAARLRSVHWPA